ncbi:MAG: DEAD/DEAH box helicase family protein [Nitrospirae bacterium]|nr:DEAD/DEAH box helicase family protein [Nitrospirota bacterium]
MLELLFTDTSENIRSFLQTVLPSFDKEWWKKYVISALSFQQQRQVEEKSIRLLSDLDLAALLRVIDKNWYVISEKAGLPREARNWVKEMQTIRNRWAHLSNQKIPKEDIYRDLDTLQRFLEVVKADSGLISKVRDRKQALYSSSVNEVKPEGSIKKESQPDTDFAKGDIVILLADSSISGAVIDILPGKPENRYVIYHNSDTATYYSSQLVKKKIISEDRKIASLDDFHAYLTALHLRHPGIANLYSLHAARINYVPYQFKPVLKLIRSDRPRLLIADEVGMGKTIEAGLILRELQARRDINSVLIICPKPLVTERKWQMDMKRFDEHFEHIDGQTLKYCISETDKDGVWPDKYTKCILPFSLFGEDLLHGTTRGRGRKRIIGLTELDPPPHFDLVIVDEAHHLRNTSTYVHQGVRFFCENAEAVIFTTATPIQLGINDLFVLLNLLRPDLIIDYPSFEHMAEPNPYINHAIDAARGAKPAWHSSARDALTRAANTSWGRTFFQNNPDFQTLYDFTLEDELLQENRVSFIHVAEQLHTFSNIISRTRRRDVGKFTTRKPETVNVDFTPEQRELHDRVLAFQSRILGRIHGDKNIAFMMTTIRRQVASCLFGLAPFLSDILTRKTDILEWEEMDQVSNSFDSDSITRFEEEITEIISKVETLSPRDPKLEALFSIIEGKQKMPNNKLLLFSSFRHTLSYLLSHLQIKGLRVGLIHGGIPDEERTLLRKRFSEPWELPESLDILLSSEVGCEGLDYQFCDSLVNYDLPWNPMRVEQRIGRIDRYGQKSDTIAIYNLITPGTVDADIYERCLLRIGVFNEAIGGGEEILGRITSEIHEVAENLSLTAEERRAKLKQLADNEIRQIKEQADLEEKQIELFGLRLPQQQIEKEVEQASNFWISSDSIKNLIVRYLSDITGSEQEYLLGEKETKTLRLNQDVRNRLLEDFRKLQPKASPLYREWERWLKGSNPNMQMTFDADYASENRGVTFITPIHPVAIQAALAWERKQARYTAFKITDNRFQEGIYPFVIYKWQKYGMRDEVVFQPVCSNALLTDKFFESLHNAVPVPDANLPSKETFDVLDEQHHLLWSKVRSEHQAHNYLLAQYRRESLQTSHKARMNILQEQLQDATNDNIRRMRQSQIKNAEIDFERRMKDIAESEAKADIISEPVAFGVVVVEV